MLVHFYPTVQANKLLSFPVRLIGKHILTMMLIRTLEPLHESELKIHWTSRIASNKARSLLCSRGLSMLSWMEVFEIQFGMDSLTLHMTVWSHTIIAILCKSEKPSTIQDIRYRTSLLESPSSAYKNHLVSV